MLRGIGDALDSHAHSWGRARKVGSLRYCEAEVEVARERWERALAGGEPEADVGGALERFAEALENASGLGPGARALAAQIAARLRQLAPGRRPRDVEAALGGDERDLVAAIRSEAAPELLREIEAEVDAALARYRERMPAKVFADLRAQSLTRQLLSARGLPRLSLFDL